MLVNYFSLGLCASVRRRSRSSSSSRW
ncbi:MAG: hypothetical protein RLZZ206_3106, partial [Cyanobacteriota bacterium]|jgi:hypothetical protein